MKSKIAYIRSALFGIAIGDALGVPVEFKSREYLKLKPVTDMSGYGTYNLPPGTFSDDSSLTFCLAEALTKGFDLKRIADNFIGWAYDNFWTPLGNVFDIGITTSMSIRRLKEGMKPDLAGGFEETENGNGSLMRILPLVFYTKDMAVDERFRITREVSSLTHGHIRSVIACFYYLEFTRLIMEGEDKSKIYSRLQKEITPFLTSVSINPAELVCFNRLLQERVKEISENKIQSSGYVIHSLEASVWCLMTTENYKDAVLKAVNLGNDTDTIGAITGGLAGLLYGFSDIPSKWIDALARKNDIEDLANRLANS